MNIYVGNLPYSIDRDELKETFAAFGDVATARIVTDRETNRSKGFGFVEMPNDAEARQAIEALKKAADQRQKPPRRLRQPCPSLSLSDPTSLPPPPVLNEFGNDVQAHPELAEVPF